MDENKYTLPSYKAQTDKVNNVYDSSLKNDLASLKSSYDSTMVDAESTKAKIPQTYQKAANESAANYQREKAAFDEYAAGNGLNTGAGSQAQLASLNQQQSAQTGINTERANAATDAENQILKLKQDYQNAIAQANANNDYERSAALLKEYQSEAQSAVSTAQNQISMDYSQNLKRAETLAGFGDFSGYGALGYSQEQIAQMQKAWIAANPALAKKIGLTSGVYSGYSGEQQKAASGVDNSYLNGVYNRNASSGNSNRGTVISDIYADYSDGNISKETMDAAISLMGNTGARY
jgi:hypothetical protein